MEEEVGAGVNVEKVLHNGGPGELEVSSAADEANSNAGMVSHGAVVVRFLVVEERRDGGGSEGDEGEVEEKDEEEGEREKDEGD